MTNGLRWMRVAVVAAAVAMAAPMLPVGGSTDGLVMAAATADPAAKSMTGEQVRKKQLRKAKIIFLDTRSSIDVALLSCQSAIWHAASHHRRYFPASALSAVPLTVSAACWRAWRW